MSSFTESISFFKHSKDLFSINDQGQTGKWKWIDNIRTTNWRFCQNRYLFKLLEMTYKKIRCFLHIYFPYITVTPYGGVTYSEVKIFLVKQPDVVTEYRTITTSSNRTISLSGNHLIYTHESGSDKFLPM